MILRDDLTQDWHAERTAEAFDRRVYSCQNWRADVVALVDEDGVLLERAWYDPYGTPNGLPAADLSSASVAGLPDGILSGADYTQWSALFSASDLRADYGRAAAPTQRPDGVLSGADFFEWSAMYSAQTSLGRGVLSEEAGDGLRNRRGYAGYAWDPAVEKYHVRHRVLEPRTGRWNRRDPLGYVDGPTLYEYVTSSPMPESDPHGTISLVKVHAVSATDYGGPMAIEPFGGGGGNPPHSPGSGAGGGPARLGPDGWWTLPDWRNDPPDPDNPVHPWTQQPKVKTPGLLRPNRHWTSTVCNNTSHDILIWSSGVGLYVLPPGECTSGARDEGDFWYVPGRGWYKCRGSLWGHCEPTDDDPGDGQSPIDGGTWRPGPNATQCSRFCTIATTPPSGPAACASWESCVDRCLATNHDGQLDPIPPCPYGGDGDRLVPFDYWVDIASD